MFIQDKRINLSKQHLKKEKKLLVNSVTFP